MTSTCNHNVTQVRQLALYYKFALQANVRNDIVFVIQLFTQRMPNRDGIETIFHIHIREVVLLDAVF